MNYVRVQRETIDRYVATIRALKKQYPKRGDRKELIIAAKRDLRRSLYLTTIALLKGREITIVRTGKRSLLWVDDVTEIRSGRFRLAFRGKFGVCGLWTITYRSEIEIAAPGEFA